MGSPRTAMGLFFSAIPKIFDFLVILFIGWLVASLVKKVVAVLLRTIKLNDLVQRAGLADFVNKMGACIDSAGALGAVLKWFIWLIALVVAFDALGLPAVSDVLRQSLLWLLNVLVALVVLVIGGSPAWALSNVVRGAPANSALGNPESLAKVASWLVSTFGLGGRETAAEIVRNWGANGQQNQEKLARAVDEAGSDINRKAAP